MRRSWWRARACRRVGHRWSHTYRLPAVCVLDQCTRCDCPSTLHGDLTCPHGTPGTRTIP